jgi:mono/diheme cytochrome c family protein
LRRLARDTRGQLALEALWTANLISGLDSDWAVKLLDHPDAPVRSWTLRLLNRAGPITRPVQDRLVRLARDEPDAGVRSDLASTAGRLAPGDAVAVLQELIRHEEDGTDKHIPLRIWWALEQTITSDADTVVSWLDKNDVWQAPLFTEHLAGRVARRLAADRGDAQSFTRIDPDKDWKAYARHPRSRMPGGKGDYTEWETNYTPAVSNRSLTRLARLLDMAPATHRSRLLAGVRAGLEQGAAASQVPERLSAVIGRWWTEQPQTGDLPEVAARLGHPEAGKKALALVADRNTGDGGNEQTAAAVTERGREAFLIQCAPCHQPDGSGMERLATPLRNSKWVLGHEELLARIVLNGLKGDLLMPAMGTLDDQQLAATLTYVRSAWGHKAGPVSPETVARVRAASAGRKAPWTKAELSALGVPE